MADFYYTSDKPALTTVIEWKPLHKKDIRLSQKST